MISDNNEKGVFYTLFGVVAVFLAAIAFAGLVRNFSFSGDGVIKQEISELEMSLIRMEAQLNAARNDYDRDLTASSILKKDFDQTSLLLNQQREELSELESVSDLLTSQINRTQATFDQYRQLYRSQARGGANGEKLDSITTLSGRVYTLVTIRQVYMDGMSISYDGGMARLNAEDLDSSWSQRFDWNLDEQQKTKKMEQAQAAIPVAAPVKPPKRPPSRPVTAKPAIRAEKSPILVQSPEAVSLRNQVENLRNQLQDVRLELSSATDQRGNGKTRSVPGSLETWESYIQRLRLQEGQLQRQYNSTRGKLKALSPREPLGDGTQE